MKQNETINLHEAVQAAFTMDADAASEEERFIARVYLRVKRSHFIEKASSLLYDQKMAEDYVEKIDHRIAELSVA